MKREVRLFAAARQLVGKEVVEVQVASCANVRDLRAALAEQYPELAQLMEYLRFSIDAEYANNDDLIPETAEVACIPPVSGG